MAYWLAIGPVDNWKLGLSKGGVWGMNERYRNAWDKAKVGDYVLFYAMKPVKGIIGYAKVASKSTDSKPFWQQEVKQGKVLWPLRIKLESPVTLPQNNWENKMIALPPLSSGITIQRAFQLLKEQVGAELIKQVDKSVKS